MSRKRLRVADLANEAGVDLEEAVVTLWESGIDEVEEPDDLIPKGLVGAARRSLGLDDARAQLRVDYWLGVAGLDREEFTARLSDVGIALSPSSRRIPRNSLRRLRRMFARQAQIQVETRPPEIPLEPLRWDPIGHGVPKRFLSADEVEAIHATLEEDFRRSRDPISPPGVRDRGLVSSAVNRPLTALGVTPKYPTIELAAAALFHSLVHNHAFFNGNKRTALVSLAAFLDENGVVLTCEERELFRFTLRTAQHRLVPEHADERPDREVQVIARWVNSNSRRVERGERPMKWIRLKQRLRDFDCTFEPAPGVGNRLNITRTIPRLSRLRRPKTIERRTQVAWAGDGTDAERSTLHKIRRDLHLDDAHDCDSATFYAGSEIDAFIIDYRRILQRLAKL